MAKLTDIQLTFDDSIVEKDFYTTLANVNPQALLDSLGLQTIEEIQSLTDDDRKSFVLANIRQQLADSYSATKTQQAIAVLQKQATDAGKPLEAPPVPKKKSLPISGAEIVSNKRK